MAGHLPNWMGRERERVNQRSKQYEKGLAAEVGGRVQPGSGSSHRAPQDVLGREGGEVYQHKFTDKASYSITVKEWQDLAADALRLGREPVLVIDFAQHGLRLVITDSLPS